MWRRKAAWASKIQTMLQKIFWLRFSDPLIAQTCLQAACGEFSGRAIAFLHPTPRSSRHVSLLSPCEVQIPFSFSLTRRGLHSAVPVLYGSLLLDASAWAKPWLWLLSPTTSKLSEPQSKDSTARLMSLG